jgi:hypothetical protein
MPARRSHNTSGVTTRNMSRAASQDLLNLEGQEVDPPAVQVSSCPATPTRGLGGYEGENQNTVRAAQYSQLGRRTLLSTSMNSQVAGTSGNQMPYLVPINQNGSLPAHNTFQPIAPATTGSLESVYQSLAANSMNAYLDSRGLLQGNASSNIPIQSVQSPAPVLVPSSRQPNTCIAPNATNSGVNLVQSSIPVVHSSHHSRFVEPNPNLAPSVVSSQGNGGNCTTSGSNTVSGEGAGARSGQKVSDRRNVVPPDPTQYNRSAGSSHSVSSPHHTQKTDLSSRFLQAMVLEIQQSMSAQRQTYEEQVGRLRDEMRDMSRQTMEIIGQLVKNQLGANSERHSDWSGPSQAPLNKAKGPLLLNIQRQAELKELRSNNHGNVITKESTPIQEGSRPFPAGIKVGKLYSMDEYQILVNNFGYPFRGLEAMFDTENNGIVFFEHAGGEATSKVPKLSSTKGNSVASQAEPSIQGLSFIPTEETSSKYHMAFTPGHIPSGPSLVSSCYAASAGCKTQNFLPTDCVPFGSGLSQLPLSGIDPSVSDTNQVGAAKNVTPLGQPALQLRPADIPRYTGLPSERTPYDFLIELEKFKFISRSSDVHMLGKVVPLALSDRAYTWYRFEQEIREFADWDDFKRRFRREFQTTYYDQKLRRMMEDRFQGPDESLVSYIRTVLSYYERLENVKPPDSEKIDFIKRHLHPDYRNFLQGQKFTTIAELIEAAFEAQEAINLQESYRVPTSAPSIEPSLQYQPKESLVKPSASSLRSSDTYASVAGGSVQKHVNFRAEPIFRQASQSEQRFRSASPAPNSRPGSASSNRSQSPGEPRRCYLCNSTDHMRRDCPQNNQQSRSENSRTPSPNRSGLGERSMKVFHTNPSKPNQK